MPRSPRHPEPKPHPSGFYRLHLLKRRQTKPLPKPGDFFGCCTPDHTGLSGRVVFDHISGAEPENPPVGIELVLYVYRGLYDSIDEVPLPSREPNRLIPPDFYNQTIWTQGLAYIFGNWPMEAKEFLPRHVFRKHEAVWPSADALEPTRVCRFRDEHFRKAAQPSSPTSVSALGPAPCFRSEVQRTLTESSKYCSLFAVTAKEQNHGEVYRRIDDAWKTGKTRDQKLEAFNAELIKRRCKISKSELKLR